VTTEASEATDSFTESSSESAETWGDGDGDEFSTGPESWGSESADWGDGDDGGDPDLTCPPHWIDQVGSTEPDFGYAVDVHPDGSVYVAGTTNGSLDGLSNAGRSDFYLSRYAPDGVREWTRLYGTSEAEEVNSLAISPSGDVYLVGTSDGSFGGTLNAGGYDALLVKLDANGELIWTRLLGTTGRDAGYGVAVGTDADVYIAGVSVPGNRHAFVARYSPQGELGWVQQLDGAVGDGARSVGLDGDDNVYITGERHDGPAEQPSAESELFLTRLSAAGAIQWTSVVPDPGVNRGYGIAVAADGSSFVVGSTNGDLWGQGSYGSGDAFVMRHDAQGEGEWIRQLGTASVDYGSGITLSADGFVYAIGTTLGGIDGNSSSGLGDIFVTKLGSDGSKVWTQQFGTGSLDRGWAITTDPQKRVFVTGSTEGVLAGDTVFGGWDVAVARICEIEP
jgi:hypothetical protein